MCRLLIKRTTSKKLHQRRFPWNFETSQNSYLVESERATVSMIELSLVRDMA